MKNLKYVNGRVTICGSLAYKFPWWGAILCMYMCVYLLYSLKMLPSETIIAEAPEIIVIALEGYWLLVLLFCDKQGIPHKKRHILYIVQLILHNMLWKTDLYTNQFV